MTKHDIIRRIILTATNKMAEKNPKLFAPKPATPEDDALKASIFSAVASGSWGCQRNSVCRLVAALTGYDYSELREAAGDGDGDSVDVTFIDCAAVKVHTNTNSHNYPQDTVLIISEAGNEYAMYVKDGSAIEGNHLPDHGSNETYSLATEEEINAIPDEHLDLIFSKPEFNGVAYTIDIALAAVDDVVAETEAE